MLIWILTGLAFLVLILACVYGRLLYLTRIDFEPAPPAEPSSSLRIGQWLLDIPWLLEPRRYQVELKIGNQVLFLSESLDGPPDILTYAPHELRSKTVRDLLAAFDLSRELGRAASMEATFFRLSRGKHEYGRMVTRVLIPQTSGFLAFDKRLEVPDEALGDRDRLEEIIRDHKPLLIDQVKAVLPHYSWLGPNINNKPEGFMSQYGLLDSELSSVRATARVYLDYTGETLTPDRSRFAIHAGQGPRRLGLSDRRLSFREKRNDLLSFFSVYPKKFHAGYRQVGGRSGYEALKFTYFRRFDDLSYIHMRWAEDSDPEDSGTVFLTCDFMANDFDRAKAPELFSLWHHILDSAH